jgi:hypothetical protein
LSSIGKRCTDGWKAAQESAVSLESFSEATVPLKDISDPSVALIVEFNMANREHALAGARYAMNNEQGTLSQY